MSSVLQFSTFFCICCLIQGVVNHPNQDEDKRLNKKRSNSNRPEVGDFYFVEEKVNDDNVKTGRAIPQSAWSKEEKESTLPVEDKTGTQFSDEFSIKEFLSYLLNVVHELKKDIFGIKEIASLNKTKELTNSQDDFEDKNKEYKMGKENIEFKNENQQRTSNYIADYYQKNGIKLTEDEENDDDLENFSDVSDDSSHKPNEGVSMQVSKNNENTHNFKCMKIKRKPEKYSLEAEQTAAIPTSQTIIHNESVKRIDESKESEKHDFKESNTKPAKTDQNYSKASREETESETTSPPSFKTGKCIKKTNNYSDNDKNKPTEKKLKSLEYLTMENPQNKNSDEEESKNSNQDKIVVHRNPGKYSKDIDGSDFDNKYGILVQSTTLPSQSSKDVINPKDENEPYASETSSENPMYQKQQEQITSQKPEDDKRAQNNVNSLKDTEGITEHTTVSFQTYKTVRENPKHNMSTETFDTEINDSPEESKGEGSKVFSNHTTVSSNENEPNSKTDGQETSNGFDTGNTIVPVTSRNIMNTDNLNKNSSDNLSDKKGTKENDESEKSSASNQNKNDSKTQEDNRTERTKVQEENDGPEKEKSLKNKKLNESNSRNNNKEEDDNLTSVTTNALSSQDSNRGIKNNDIKGSGEPQEEQESDESLNKSAGMQEISPDEEYEFEEDFEDFDVSDELNDEEDFNQNQERELNKNNGNHEDDDKINLGNTGTLLAKESQISQRTGYVMEENSQEQYDTFLEYFYKHSNNPYFQFLKNQSNNLPDDQD